MIPFTSEHNYFMYTGITDFRKGFNGLCGIVSNAMESNPTNGDVYVFMNKRNNQIRLLVFDKDGLTLLSKRLEKGTYERKNEESSEVKNKLTWTELVCIMQGIKLKSVRYKKRYVMKK